MAYLEASHASVCTCLRSPSGLSPDLEHPCPEHPEPPKAWRASTLRTIAADIECLFGSFAKDLQKRRQFAEFLRQEADRIEEAE